MVINGHNHGDFSGKIRGCEDYIQALEEERRKIEVFQRELPLCLELVTQAIDSCKQQLSGTTAECNFNGQSECNSDQTSSQVPVLEEFIPIKRPSSSSRCGSEEQELKKKPRNESNGDEQIATMMNAKPNNDWLRSAQLWNQTSDPVTKEDSPRKIAVVEVKRTGAFHPFKKEKTHTATPPPQEPPPAPATDGGLGKKEDKEGQQAQRKARRCWSPELHRRFVQALQQLGGSHVATPKQIRELMKVDGLTNDEVKSHLQKYRLHTRRPAPPVQSSPTNPPPQFAVVVGGIWAVPPEYASVANSGEAGSGVVPAAESNEIYAPVAVKSLNFQEERSKGSKSGNSGDSPASSSSTQTTTASPPP